MLKPFGANDEAFRSAPAGVQGRGVFTTVIPLIGGFCSKFLSAIRESRRRRAMQDIERLRHLIPPGDPVAMLPDGDPAMRDRRS
jgi:hypothetical protein